MKNTDIFNAIGGISDSLINETEARPHGGKVFKIVAIAAATLAIGAAAVAAPIIFAGSHSDGTNIPDYYSAPSAETLIEDTGLDVNVPENIAGYSFEGGHIRNDEDYDVNGNVILKYKSLFFTYSKGGDVIYVSIDASPNVQTDGFEDCESYEGCEIKYASYTNKLVPGNYEMTQQDKKDEESGKYVFSYGAPEVKIQEVQLLQWRDGDVNYTLNVMDSPLSKDEFIGAAREIIDFQR